MTNNNNNKNVTFRSNTSTLWLSRATVRLSVCLSISNSIDLFIIIIGNVRRYNRLTLICLAAQQKCLAAPPKSSCRAISTEFRQSQRLQHSAHSQFDFNHTRASIFSIQNSYNTYNTPHNTIFILLSYNLIVSVSLSSI